PGGRAADRAAAPGGGGRGGGGGGRRARGVRGRSSLSAVTDPAPQPVPVLGVAETVKKTHAGRLKAVPNVEAALERIARTDPALNAFSVVLGERAVEEARAVDKTRKADRGPLHGVPV